jgi:hypothetical protein
MKLVILEIVSIVIEANHLLENLIPSNVSITLQIIKSQTVHWKSLINHNINKIDKDSNNYNNNSMFLNSNIIRNNKNKIMRF